MPLRPFTAALHLHREYKLINIKKKHFSLTKCRCDDGMSGDARTFLMSAYLQCADFVVSALKIHIFWSNTKYMAIGGFKLTYDDFILILRV